MKLRTARVTSWLLQVTSAAILAQTLFFKFTGAEESRYIFSALGLEPAGRYAAGAAELIAAILLLTPRTAVVGAALTVSIMGGAIASHLTRLGVVVQDDGGLLFALAVLVLLSAIGVLALRRDQFVALIRAFHPHAIPSAPSANTDMSESAHESH